MPLIRGLSAGGGEGSPPPSSATPSVSTTQEDVGASRDLAAADMGKRLRFTAEATLSLDAHTPTPGERIEVYAQTGDATVTDNTSFTEKVKEGTTAEFIYDSTDTWLRSSVATVVSAVQPQQLDLAETRDLAPGDMGKRIRVTASATLYLNAHTPEPGERIEVFAKEADAVITDDDAFTETVEQGTTATFVYDSADTWIREAPAGSPEAQEATAPKPAPVFRGPLPTVADYNNELPEGVAALFSADTIIGVDEDPVTSWGDDSGHPVAPAFDHAPGQFAPRLRTAVSGLKGHACLEFESDDELCTSLPLEHDGSFSVAVVFRQQPFSGDILRWGNFSIGYDDTSLTINGAQVEANLRGDGFWNRVIITVDAYTKIAKCYGNGDTVSGEVQLDASVGIELGKLCLGAGGPSIYPVDGTTGCDIAEIICWIVKLLPIECEVVRDIWELPDNFGDPAVEDPIAGTPSPPPPATERPYNSTLPTDDLYAIYDADRIDQPTLTTVQEWAAEQFQDPTKVAPPFDSTLSQLPTLRRNVPEINNNAFVDLSEDDHFATSGPAGTSQPWSIGMVFRQQGAGHLYQGGNFTIEVTENNKIAIQGGEFGATLRGDGLWNYLFVGFDGNIARVCVNNSKVWNTTNQGPLQTTTGVQGLNTDYGGAEGGAGGHDVAMIVYYTENLEKSAGAYAPKVQGLFDAFEARYGVLSGLDETPTTAPEQEGTAPVGGGGAGSPASTHTVDLASTGDHINQVSGGLRTVDGVQTVEGDRVLLKDQSTGARKNNGIYVVSSGSWTRATDYDEASEVNGAVVEVTGGSTNGSTKWKLFDTITTVGNDDQRYYDVTAGDAEPTHLADLATTDNINRNGRSVSVDGVSSDTYVILVKNQTDPAQNGIFASNFNAWNRVAEYNEPSEINGSRVLVQIGNTQAGTVWEQVNTIATVNTDSIEYAEVI